MSERLADVIVVGSGASAVHAAYPIAESGASTLMLDTGLQDANYYQSLIPDQPFAEIRRTDRQQHRYFLGDRFEGVPLAKLGAGPQVTPPRQHVLRDAERLSPIVSGSFEALQSFAIGGLAGAWGAVAFPFLDNEFVKAGLRPEELRPHYETIARRIGISGCSDDLEPLRGPLHSLLPPLDLDHNAKKILSRYNRKREKLRRAGITVGRPVMAVLTQALKDRNPHAYHDMDFWSNCGDSVYRPASTIRELQAYRNFTYRPCYRVEAFTEHADRISVHATSLETGSGEVFGTRRLILAAGALGTGKIALRSLGQYGVPVPITCNPHLYVPCLNYRNLGAAPDGRCHSLAQLTAIYDPTGDSEHLVQAQLYSCRSLLLFRLLKESPLPYPESLRVMRALYNSMVVLVIQFEDYQAATKRCILRRGAGESQDYLEIEYAGLTESERAVRQGVQALRKLMKELGCLTLRVVEPGHGSSVHYASLLPFSSEEKPLTTDPCGRLRGTRAVYVADGAAFAYLPAKGLTFTLMANANRVGQRVLEHLEE